METHPGTLRRHTRVCSEKPLTLGALRGRAWAPPPPWGPGTGLCASLFFILTCNPPLCLSSSGNLWSVFISASFCLSLSLSFMPLLLSVSSLCLSISDPLPPFSVFLCFILSPCHCLSASMSLCVCVSVFLSLSVLSYVSFPLCFLLTLGLSLSLCLLLSLPPGLPLGLFMSLTLSRSLLMLVSASVSLSCSLAQLWTALPFSRSTQPHSGAKGQRHRDLGCPRESEAVDRDLQHRPCMAAPSAGTSEK